MSTPNRRYALADLLEATGLTEAACGRASRWSGRTLNNVRDNGLSERQADAAAIRFGRHPVEVWHDWFECEDENPPGQEPAEFIATDDDGKPDVSLDPVIFDLTAVDEFWQAAVDLQAVLAAVDARLAAANGVVERRQLHRLSAQEVAILVQRERDCSQGASETVAA